MALTTRTKQITTTISTIFGGAAILVGVVSDGPGVIKTLIDKGPWILQQPIAWWIAGVIAFEAVVIYLIWSRPTTNERMQLRTSGGVIPDHIPLQVHLLSELLEGAQQMLNYALEDDTSASYRSYIESQFCEVFSIQIRELLGDAAYAKYMQELAEAKKSRTRHKSIFFEKMYVIIESMVLPELDKERQKQREERRLALCERERELIPDQS